MRASKVSRTKAEDRDLCHGFVSRAFVVRHTPVTIAVDPPPPDPPPRRFAPKLGVSGVGAKRSPLFENLAHVVLLGATSGAKPQRLLVPVLGLRTS